MKLLSRVFAACLFLSVASLSSAHEDHEHAAPLDQTTAVAAADIKIAELIDAGKLTANWARETSATAELVRVNGLQNWVVSYTDEVSKQRLQLLFTTAGEYVSMNQSNV